MYESMLQFLSLSYEAIVGGFLDMVESGTAQANQGPKVYKELMDIFVLVASPFDVYQKQLPKFEMKCLGEQTQMLSKNIQKATMAVSGARVDLEILQSATDQLQELSVAVFPLAENAVARLELLNGGYATSQALMAIDRLLAGHAGEIAIAVHKLSVSLTSDEQALVDSFDESHVLCALGILKVAGSFVRCHRLLENQSRERLNILCQRVAAHTARDKEVMTALDMVASGGKITFKLLDSMSIVEINSLITRTVCVGVSEEEFGISYGTLQSLALKTDYVQALFPNAADSSKKIANSCHTFVYDVCSSVPRLYLSGMSSMGTWREISGGDSTVSYGILPQEYITHVGEHMLSLVQALEPFASDKEALELANEVMDGVRCVAQQPWLDFISASGALGSEKMVLDIMSGKEIDRYMLGTPMDDDHEDEDDELKEVTAFCNAWLDVVGLAVTGRLLERIMRIPLLTQKGCEHLNADLGYLVNVLSALGVSGHPHPLLGHLAELTIVDRQVLLDRITTFDRSEEMASLVHSIEERLLAMRSNS